MGETVKEESGDMMFSLTSSLIRPVSLPNTTRQLDLTALGWRIKLKYKNTVNTSMFFFILIEFSRFFKKDKEHFGFII